MTQTSASGHPARRGKPTAGPMFVAFSALAKTEDGVALRNYNGIVADVPLLDGQAVLDNLTNALRTVVALSHPEVDPLSVTVLNWRRPEGREVAGG